MNIKAGFLTGGAAAGVLTAILLAAGGTSSPICPAVTGVTHPPIAPMTITQPGLYNGDGATINGGENNITVDASNVTICNYVLRNANGAGVNIPDQTRRQDNVVVSNVMILDYNQANLSAGGPQYLSGVACWYCTHLTVVDSTLSTTRNYGDDIWIKRSNAHEAGPDYIARNTISGGWDGIGSEPEGDVDGGIGTGSVIENNSVSNCHDDGIQIDGRDENITARNNTITTCGTGFSVAPALIGPVHIDHNYIHDLRYGLSTAFFCYKLGASGPTTAEIDFTNNTCLGGSGLDPSGNGPGGFTQANPGLNFKIISSHNCIQSGYYVIEFNDTPAAGSSFDYDTLYTTDPTGRFAKWAGNRYDLAGLQGLGQEKNGVRAQGCPMIQTSTGTTISTPTPVLTTTPAATQLPTPTGTSTTTTTATTSAIPTPTPNPLIALVQQTITQLQKLLVALKAAFP